MNLQIKESPCSLMASQLMTESMVYTASHKCITLEMFNKYNNNNSNNNNIIIIVIIIIIIITIL